MHICIGKIHYQKFRGLSGQASFNGHLVLIRNIFSISFPFHLSRSCMVALVPLLYIVQAAGSCLTVNKLNLPRSNRPTNGEHIFPPGQTWKTQILDGNVKVQPAQSLAKEPLLRNGLVEKVISWSEEWVQSGSK